MRVFHWLCRYFYPLESKHSRRNELAAEKLEEELQDIEQTRLASKDFIDKLQQQMNTNRNSVLKLKRTAVIADDQNPDRLSGLVLVY